MPSKTSRRFSKLDENEKVGQQASIVLNNGASNGFKLEKYFSSNELANYHCLPEQVKLDWISGRVALKRAAQRNSDFLSLAPQQIEIGNRPSGQPYIKGHDNCYVSIAHSNGYGVGAVAPWRIGVDLESVHYRSQSLLRHIVRDEEIRITGFASQCASEQITLIWTIKEAVLKGLGVGFNLSPKCVRIYDANASGLLLASVQQETITHWAVQSIKLDNLWMSVAVEYEQTTLQTKPIWHRSFGLSFAST